MDLQLAAYLVRPTIHVVPPLVYPVFRTHNETQGGLYDSAVSFTS